MAIRLSLVLFILLPLAHSSPSLAQIPFTQQSHPQIGVSAPAPSPSSQGSAVLEVPQKRSGLTVDAKLSREASEYLHHHRLPYVDAKVLVDDVGIAKSVVLTGQVRTDFGKQDAERKLRASRDQPSLAIRNQIEVNGELASETDIMPGHQNELELNPVFLGCWRGTTLGHDTQQWLGSCGPPVDVPTKVELCLRKQPDVGFAITYQDVSAPVPNFRDHTELVSSNGRNSIGLHSVRTYDSGSFASSHMKWNALWNCDLVRNGGWLACSGSNFTICNGRLWTKATWHFTLQRVR